ncbi:MAG: sugar ABC transporter permease [Chthonomonadaceae bacterium]|uniref:Spermidine/putrescine ABC transporter permease n=1 Tax=Candidatus Nitrosymbiomonas proteolyticus TaxID=2608984 RepID=A0A809SDE0_9BACT|nr:Lactose transport system permease protein LacF [Fimbriimonadaceae bacterium]RIJ99637.1 MAG: spermidine/putrescine ABC transporter permease [Armatimonadota bacterium]BBO22944.1 spermidine/putrescine ABC transporter permease [Candidatus Nitrosymbiomonas proteolyticus]GIK31339.1 MAG: sugar ABC transporter permease [Armatimonadota bacterium]
MTLRRKEAWMGVLFASPWIVGFCGFMLYPVVASMYFSFCDYSVLRKPIWIGTDNYSELLSDELFWVALKNTFLYAVMALPLSALAALGLALLLNTKIRGLTVYRTIFFLPSLVPLVSLAVLWLWMFNGQTGLVNVALGSIGISGPNWLGDPTWSKPALVLMAMWGVGHAMVIYLAGLQSVPVSLFEAAQLDGAGAWKKTRHITLPMISPVIMFNVIMGMIGTLQVFTVPYVMFPNGAPARSTYFYTMYLYDNAFRYLRMGYASAMGWLMFLIIFALTLISLKLMERRVHYAGD